MNKLSNRVYHPSLSLKSTKVLMENGYYKPMAEIQVGERLYGGNTVTSNELSESELIEIETTLGYIRVFPDQRFVMKDGSIKRAKDLEKLDVLDCVPIPSQARCTNLTDEELRFLGCWLANGIIKKRNVIGFLAHKSDTLQKVRNLKVSTRNDSSSPYSKGLALSQKRHPELAKLILSLTRKEPLLEFGYEEYSLIYEGYLLVGGHLSEKINTLYLHTRSRSHALFIQYCSILDGLPFKIGKIDSKVIGFFGESDPKFHMIRGKNAYNHPIATILKLTKIEHGMVYRLTTDGDHSFFADNLHLYGE